MSKRKRSVSEAIETERMRYVRACKRHDTKMAHIHRLVMLKLQHALSRVEIEKGQIGHDARNA